jgi:acetylxylan esterase
MPEEPTLLRRRSTAAGALTLLIGLLAPAAAAAASMQKVSQSDWWAGVTGLPTYVNMYSYVPDKLATKPPILVGPHHCQGTAQSTFSEMASLVSIADQNGFIMIFPEATGENCWDAGSTRSLKHGGGGDTGAIVQMVKYVQTKYGADTARVYTVGGSSGAIMTEALLGVYPDVFMAGVSLMGVPCGCWAAGYNDTTGTGSSAQWSGSCAGGNVTKTGMAWGDLVRSYFPGYTGHRPRLQHWHGTADTTLNFKNMAEDVKEWTNLLGLAETPTGSDTPKSGTTRQYWKNACGYTVYETFALSGVGHAVPFDGKAVAAYFGLDVAGGSDPETAACGAGGSGAGGMGGGGMSGATGSGGVGGRGMGGRASGGMDAGGRAGSASGGASGGMTTSGGAGAQAGSGGAPSGGAGNAPTGGASVGGSTAVAGAGATGDGGRGGNPTSAGSGGTGGSQGGGAGAVGVGGSTPSAGTKGVAGPVAESSGANGCGCRIDGRTPSSLPAYGLVGLVALVAARRRRSRLTGRRH